MFSETLMHIFRTFWEFILSADATALSRNSQVVHQGDPQKALHNITCNLSFCTTLTVNPKPFLGSPDSAVLSGNP